MTSKLEDYEVVYTLGSASHGVVRKIKCKEDGTTLIWKEIDIKWMSDVQRKALISEVNFLKDLKHKNIVRYHDKVVDHKDLILYIITEYCGGGNLKQLISHCQNEGIHLQEDLVWRILYQVSHALLECHSRNKKNGDGNNRPVLHRNIKTTNVFIDEWNNIKLGDFGYEVLVTEEIKLNRIQHFSNSYISPELMNSSNYNEKSDIWALGCLIYELCSFSPPFQGSNNAQLALKIRSGNFNRIPSCYSNELQNIIAAMLTVEDVLRPTIDLIVQHPRISALNHRSEDCETKKFSFLNTPTKNKAPLQALKDRMEIVKRREQAVRTKELLLDERQKDFEKREKKLVLKERMIEERLARAEIYLKQSKSKATNGLTEVTSRSLSSQNSQLELQHKVHFFSDPNINKDVNRPLTRHVHFNQTTLNNSNKENEVGNSVKFKAYKFQRKTVKELWVDGPMTQSVPDKNFKKQLRTCLANKNTHSKC